MAQEETTSAESPHDVLAADEFALPAADPELHHKEPVQLPEDPTGTAEPHDVLAAEEFPMPAPRPHPAVSLVDRRGGPRQFALELGALLLGFVLLRRLLGGGRSA